MENYQWIFDGIGTAIVSSLLGLIVGGISGYKFAIKKNSTQKQKQKAGKNSVQVQIGRINNG